MAILVLNVSVTIVPFVYSTWFVEYCSCQFIVSTSGDYNIHCGDPDKLVEWNCIEQVVRLLF